MLSEKSWTDLIYNVPVETKEQFENRINEFIWNSIPEQGELWTSPGLRDKVLGKKEAKEKGINLSEVGSLKTFYGNTLVFPLDSKAIEHVKEIQNQLNDRCSYLFADLLVPDTFHMTLHDLVNGTQWEDIKHEVKLKGFAALSILEQLKKMDIPKMRMESTCLFNMASTSVVLGLKPMDEESCQILMMLYEIFQVVKPLGYKLTPHITLAYFKPGIYLADVLKSLREVIWEVNQQDKLILEIDVKELVYQEFDSMNHYVRKSWG